jgi:hypothetical protein
VFEIEQLSQCTSVEGTVVIRRTALVAAAAVGLVLAPTAAMAYEAPGFGSTISNTAPAAGTPVTVRITGAAPNSPVTLTITTSPASIPNSAIQIAGTKSLTKTADASGVVTFQVTLSQSGRLSLVATTATGAVISSQSLTVAALGTDPTSTSSVLGETGFDGGGLAVGAGALILAGAGAVFVARRRQSAKANA